MKYYLLTIGCQMNKSDAERLARVLEDLGYQKTDQESQADLIGVLACSVRQSAIDRIYGRVNKWQKMKRKKKLKTLLTGCVLEPDKKKLAEDFDLIFDIRDLNKLPEKLKKLPPLPQKYLHIPPLYTSSFQAFVPISNGCNNFCSYCVVPYVRGRETSRPAPDIVAEVKNLSQKGYREITLIGQNVNSWGQYLKKENQSFLKLLKELNDMPGQFWLRFVTNHPKDMSEELIKQLPKLEKVCEYIHLPLQSGNDKILTQMNRQYTARDYLKLVKKLRETIPNLALSTDIIVGFPGETEKQFENTAQMMKKIKFDLAYIAEYSPRPGTAAFKLKDDVPKEEKKKREQILTAILKKTALENNQKYVGKKVEILTEGRDKKGYPFGKTRTFKKVRIKGHKKIPAGQFIQVKITKADVWGLEGKLTQ